MALPARDGATCTVNNEAMYRTTWATFVDGAISMHQKQGAGGGEGSVDRGGRIELRDVMVLEEVLAKIENAAVVGDWNDRESRPPATAVGLMGDVSMESERSSAVGTPWSGSLPGRIDRYESAALHCFPRVG